MRHADSEPNMELDKLNVERLDLMNLAAQLMRFDEITMSKQESGLKAAFYTIDGSYSKEKILSLKRATWFLNSLKDINVAMKSLNDIMDNR